MRSENRFGRSSAAALRARGIEPVWRDGLSVATDDVSRVASFALLDPGARIEQLRADSILPGNRQTRILDDVTEYLRLGDRGQDDSGVRMQPYRDYRGVMVVGARAWLDGFDFALVTEVDESEAHCSTWHRNA